LYSAAVQEAATPSERCAHAISVSTVRSLSLLEFLEQFLRLTRVTAMPAERVHNFVLPRYKLLALNDALFDGLEMSLRLKLIHK
jgi:hypothetical protein